MCKDTTNNGVSQEKNLFSFQDVLPDRKIQVDFNAPDISSNGGLVLVGLMKDSIARKVARLIPDYRNQLFVQHSYEEMVCLEKSVQIDPCRRKNVTLFGEIRLTLGDEIKMTPVGILRRGFFL